MPTVSQVTLGYTLPRTLEKESRQTDALENVTYDPPSELLALAFASAVAMPVPGGIMVEVYLEPVVGQSPSFEELFPTTAAQVAAVANLFTQQIEQARRCPVTALTPTIQTV